MRKTRKNLRTSRKGGDGNWNPNSNWNPRRPLQRPVFLDTKMKLEETMGKYVHGDEINLSSYQNNLISGTDREKEEARNDLNIILIYLKELKGHFKSYTFRVGMLVSAGLGMGLSVLEPSAMIMYYKGAKYSINEIKMKLSINDVIQTIEKLLKETDVETTTINPLMYKKAGANAIPANIVERNGELVVKLKNNNNNNSKKYKGGQNPPILASAARTPTPIV